LCFGAVVRFFGAVFGWAFGCQGACGVCSRLLEMADIRCVFRAGFFCNVRGYQAIHPQP
jgi:hypothetical protein